MIFRNPVLPALPPASSLVHIASAVKRLATHENFAAATIFALGAFTAIGVGMVELFP